MGCDIHLVIERRRKNDREWVGIFSSDDTIGTRPPIAQRDYDFFAEVASVRGRSKALRYPRNVPEDISALAWQNYMQAPTDHHSASHMPAAEFAAIHHEVNPDCSRAEFAAYDLLGLNRDTKADYRVVFWFDN